MALTRASEELYVWVARMSWAEDTWTAKLQSFAMGCKLSLLGGMLAEACQRVFGFRVTQEDVARLWSMWQYEVPEQEEHCHGDALRRWQAPSASEFFDEPELCVEVWDELDWFPVPPALPKLEGCHEAEAMEEQSSVNATGCLVPFLPLHQFGKNAYFLPLLFWFPATPVYHWDSSNADLFLPAVKIMRQACRLLQSAGSTVEYSVEYHKLDQEEIGGQTWFVKHCNAVRGACVLRDVGQNQRPRVAKLYCGMGTEGQT